MASLDEHLQELAELAVAERAVAWELGDRFCVIVKEHGKEALRKVAEVMHHTTEWVRQKARVAAAFPRELRYPDKPWSLYRAVYSRARSLEVDPKELLNLALENEWSERDVAAYGRKEKKRIKWHRECAWCNTVVNLTVDDLGAVPIICPVCLAEAAPQALQVVQKELGKAGREPLLGVLE